MSDLKTIAISCGDLNGIGIETLVKTFSDKRMYKYCIPILYANKDVFLAHQAVAGVGELELNVIQSVQEAQKGKLNVLQVWNEDVTVNFGQPDASIATYTVQSLTRATKDVIDGAVDALVTLPINKDVISSDEFKYRGHTNYLRDAVGADDCLMFLISDVMRIGVVTGHVPIKDVAQKITQAAILRKVQLMNQSLIQDFGIDKPKIAILGLNPHAGDNGVIGTEEHTVIIPAIEKLTADQIIAVGPYSSDGFFGMAMYKKYDGIIAMYHDQGLLPFKMMSFEDGVNYTAGLPIVRTSPDHGTAYDIAGKGIASPTSLRNSIFKAVEIATMRAAE